MRHYVYSIVLICRRLGLGHLCRELWFILLAPIKVCSMKFTLSALFMLRFIWAFYTCFRELYCQFIVWDLGSTILDKCGLSHFTVRNFKHHLSEIVFSGLVGFSLYTRSTHHRVKQSPRSTIEMSSVAYVMCGAWDRSCDQEAIGTFITTMLQHILRTWFRLFFWQKNSCALPGSLRLLATFSHPKVGYFSNNKNPSRALNNTSLKCCLPSTGDIDRRKKIRSAEPEECT